MTEQGPEDPKETDKLTKAKLEQEERDRRQEAERLRREREQRDQPDQWPEIAEPQDSESGSFSLELGRGGGREVRQDVENRKVTARLERQKKQEALRQQGERERREQPERWPEILPAQQAVENSRVTARLERQKREQQGRERTDQPASSNEGEGQNPRPWWRKIFGR